MNNLTEARAGFLAAAPQTEHAQSMYDSDVELQGYVANLTRVWAYSPEALGALSFMLRQSMEMSGMTAHQRALLTSVAAATLGDSYCSLAFGRRLAATGGDVAAVQALTGRAGELLPDDRVLATWARKVVEDPSSTTAADLDELREAGYDDSAIFALTLFVALRVTFSTVNSALGAGPDAELAERVPEAVLDAVTWGRPVG
jgi:alkylhydroperoxidase family enzyme